MIMKIRKIFEIVTGLENIADAQDTCIHEILDALVGVCFDEEEAGDIKPYIEKRQGDFERRQKEKQEKSPLTMRYLGTLSWPLSETKKQR